MNEAWNASGQSEDESGVQTIERTSTTPRVRHPRMFQVVLLNDDYTSMEFVVEILEQVFSRTPGEAVQIMLRVHKEGRGIAGIYPRDIAEAKVREVHTRARAREFPLRCEMQPVP